MKINIPSPIQQLFLLSYFSQVKYLYLPHGSSGIIIQEFYIKKQKLIYLTKHKIALIIKKSVNCFGEETKIGINLDFLKDILEDFLL